MSVERFEPSSDDVLASEASLRSEVHIRLSVVVTNALLWARFSVLGVTAIDSGRSRRGKDCDLPPLTRIPRRLRSALSRTFIAQSNISWRISNSP